MNKDFSEIIFYTDFSSVNMLKSDVKELYMKWNVVWIEI